MIAQQQKDILISDESWMKEAMQQYDLSRSEVIEILENGAKYIDKQAQTITMKDRAVRTWLERNFHYNLSSARHNAEFRMMVPRKLFDQMVILCKSNGTNIDSVVLSFMREYVRIEAQNSEGDG